MYQLKTHYSPKALKDKWEKMTPTSVYQTFWIQNELWYNMPVYGVMNGYVPVYYEVIEHNETQMIFPLCKYIGKNEHCVLGMINGFQIYDIICMPGLEQQKIDEMVLFVVTTIRTESIRIACLPETALLYRAIMNLEGTGVRYRDKEKHENVLICAEQGYDDYYAGLSKHTRQNLRTAYNRMARDGVRPYLEVIIGKPLDRKLLRRLIDIYCKRHNDRYGVKTSPLKKLYLNVFDFSTRSLQNNAGNFYAILYIGGEIAAFMAGMHSPKRDSIIIPRLSINDSFSQYSPGMVMINETMKYMTKDMGICSLDLSKGAEQYKFSMGGTSYPTYSLELMQKTV